MSNKEISFKDIAWNICKSIDVHYIGEIMNVADNEQVNYAEIGLIKEEISKHIEKN